MYWAHTQYGEMKAEQCVYIILQRDRYYVYALAFFLIDTIIRTNVLYEQATA